MRGMSGIRCWWTRSKTVAVVRLMSFGSDNLQPDGHFQGYVRFSTDEGRTWNHEIKVPELYAVNEAALVRARNGDIVAACRTDNPQRFKNEIDHYGGLGVSLSKDNGSTWSKRNMLFEFGRHHPSMVLLPNGDLVMTYVVRKGYVATPDGFPRFGIEAVVSHDQGQTWDLDHGYLLHAWVGRRKGPNAWWPSSQATSTILLPAGSLLTAFGSGYRSESGPENRPRDVGLVLWRLGDQPLNSDRTMRDVPFDSNRATSSILKPANPVLVVNCDKAQTRSGTLPPGGEISNKGKRGRTVFCGGTHTVKVKRSELPLFLVYSLMGYFPKSKTACRMAS